MVNDMNARSAGTAFHRSVGSYRVVAVDPTAEQGEPHAVIRYEVPLDWCHSYDTSIPVDETNLPTAQGGLLCGLLDNAMTLARVLLTQRRTLATEPLLSMSFQPLMRWPCLSLNAW